MIAIAALRALVFCRRRSRTPARTSASCASSATLTCSATATCRHRVDRRSGRRPQINRGILRDFPTIYRRADGSRVEVGFEIQFVTLDGAHENYVTETDEQRRSRPHRQRRPELSTGWHLMSSATAPRGRSASSRLRRALLERDRHRLDLPDRQAEARIPLPEHGAVPADRVLHRAAGRARAGRHRSSSRSRAASCFAPPGRCPPRTASPSRRAGRRAWCSPPDAAATDRARCSRTIRRCGRGHRRRAGHRLLPARLAPDRPRSAQGHHHSAVRPAEGYVGCRRPLCPPDRHRQSGFAAALIELGVNGRLKLVDRGARSRCAHRTSGKPSTRPEQALEAKLFAELALAAARHRPITRQIGKAKDALQEALEQRLQASCSPTISGWSGWASWRRSSRPRRSWPPIASATARQRAGHCHRNSHPAHTTHDRRRWSRAAGGSFRRPWPDRMDRACLSLIAFRRSARRSCTYNARLRSERSARRWCPVCWRRSPRSASAGCRRRTWKAAVSWTRSTASSSISASPRRTGSNSQPAGQDARAVRALPALCHRAPCREQLGQALHRRAGGGRRRRRGVVLVFRRPRIQRRAGVLSPIASATISRARLHRRRRRRDRAAAASGVQRRLERRRLLGRRRRRGRRVRLVMPVEAIRSTGSA